MIDLGFKKFRTKKLQTTITFGRELGWRRSKNESCSKWGNKSGNSKIPSFKVSFLFFCYFSPIFL